MQNIKSSEIIQVNGGVCSCFAWYSPPCGEGVYQTPLFMGPVPYANNCKDVIANVSAINPAPKLGYLACVNVEE